MLVAFAQQMIKSKSFLEDLMVVLKFGRLRNEKKNSLFSQKDQIVINIKLSKEKKNRIKIKIKTKEKKRKVLFEKK